MKTPNKHDISADREILNSSRQFRPAVVRYIGRTNKDFTNGKEYEAYLLSTGIMSGIICTSVITAVKSPIGTDLMTMR